MASQFFFGLGGIGFGEGTRGTLVVGLGTVVGTVVVVVLVLLVGVFMALMGLVITVVAGPLGNTTLSHGVMLVMPRRPSLVSNKPYV